MWLPPQDNAILAGLLPSRYLDIGNQLWDDMLVFTARQQMSVWSSCILMITYLIVCVTLTPYGLE